MYPSPGEGEGGGWGVVVLHIGVGRSLTPMCKTTPQGGL